MDDANQARALQHLQVVADRPLRQVELAGELLGRPRAFPKEADDSPTELVCERLELLGVVDEQDVVGGIVGEVAMVDDRRTYGKCRPLAS
ncbi:MAG: hypothetical protein R6W48_09525 [Gaiellaceae bacterium]